MCGIIAIFGSDELEKDVKNSLKKIEHRGNSNYETLIFPLCALGANRLAITDRSGGKQPVANEDGTVFAVFNGELFNYRELKERLIGKGHIFKTDCDTEVLVHLWEEYGVEMIHKLDSEMYSFVIYDKKEGNFFIARDYLGVKPLYYAQDSGGRFFVASEIKQLADYETIKEIREFPPGHYYYKGSFSRYYSFAEKLTRDSEETVKRTLKKLIECAIYKRVQTDLPIGVFLSGGVDSSLVMELATRYHKEVTAIILGTETSSDYLNAVRLCKEKGWKYSVVRPEVDYEKETERAVYYVESYEPNIVRHSFANDLVSRHAFEMGLKIVLVGEGADELFAGYNEFMDLPLGKVNYSCVI